MTITPQGLLSRWATIALAVFVVSIRFASPSQAEEHGVIPLWQDTAPGSEGKTGDEHVRMTPAGDHVITNIHRPSLTLYLPSKETATGAAVLIIPGGGHREIWMDHEGYNIAQWLSQHGIAAFILKYRLAREPQSTYTIEGHSVMDAHRALRLIRHRAAEWGVDPARLGVMGFSAGGELASAVSLHFEAARPNETDPIERESDKPAFQALIYPGRSQQIIPTAESPPAFLACGYKDRPDISEGLAKVYLLFRSVGVPAELHIYSEVGHGFGYRPGDRGPSSKWLDRFYEWIEARGILKPNAAPVK